MQLISGLAAALMYRGILGTNSIIPESTQIESGKESVWYACLHWLEHCVKESESHVAAWVQQHLVYCVQFWLLYYRRYVSTLERVQKSYTRMLPELESIDRRGGLPN